MLYTRKGDSGTTKTFGARDEKGAGVEVDGRISKASCQIEALGALDELNSFLGLVKVKLQEIDGAAHPAYLVSPVSPDEIYWIQNLLFVVQAGIAGADKHIPASEIKKVEEKIDAIEKELPPIRSFFVAGGTEIAVLFDILRTMARRTEREVVRAMENGEVKFDENILAFLNRLSSLLYGWARLSNHKSGINEQVPKY